MNIESVDSGLAGLNPPQKRAVLHDGGPLVVFAGAGSGKTRVITHRVAHLVAERGVAPWNVLAVTFTNKAASEMRERLGRLIGPRARDLWVGTFHATCARLLRRYAKEIGLARDFSIYDDADTRAMIKRTLKELDLDEKRYDPKRVAGRIATEKQEVRGPDEMIIDNIFDEPIQRVYARYEERMRAANALDFGDLIYRMVVALESDDALRAELSRRFRHLLVDEFQDTNRAQYRLVRALSAAHREVTVVGDDDQSIYRWRGADRRNILDFRKEFPDAQTIKLEQNYRSTQRILRGANAIISRALDREPKELWTQNPEGPPITVLTCEDERREAQLIVTAVAELRAAGRSLEEIALFYRIHAQSRVFEEQLRRDNVPYRIIGGMRFYDRAEIKDVLAYLRLLANPADDVSALRILNVPARGIGKKSIEALLDLAARRGKGVWDALVATVAAGGSGAKRFRGFVDLIGDLMQKRDSGVPLAALGYAVYADSGYKQWLEEQDTPESDARLQNVQELLGAIQLAQEDEPELDLAGFLERVTLESAERAEGEESEEKLTLMTVHAAKGLEFPVVVVAGLEEDSFPFRRGQEPLDAEELEEERRLAYVALTRAEERLLLTWARSRRMFGRDVRYMVPSRFLGELPADDVSWPGRDRRAPARSSQPMRRAPVRRAPPAEPRVPGDSYVDTSDGSDMGGPYVGMSVRHVKFGLGRIVAIKPSVPPRVDVDFPKAGVRTIQLSYLSPA
ncbi:MAG: UvrD-helicase domain-containing protein [Sandaracinaceae bacterium]|nr:UvrD-helicase domain-containing protein [Sandaracinaceae bacterium]